MFNKNNYVLKTPRTISGISQILDNNTLDRETLRREKTNKLFIGKVGSDSFYIISSSPIGISCAISGIITSADDASTEIRIETKLPKAFIVLFVVWSIFTSGAFVYAIISQGRPALSMIISFVIMIVLFRLLLSVMYSRSRDAAIKMIERLLA
ncbi:hypothetical protein [Mucilaginibacter jinjuensis]|uniref:Uncharacterized protein n=1 Tax=Mucilaginibacter jinjuensis TaxID=1176721 RepID=A0ABY7T7H3_9SPHI|nr:hypothetical protein [Mucilaginibacter jinjuensis]WCT11796.1 hypothetical protein PQO05_23990 [Mucilaginibacter jinjuensis]